MSVSTDIEVSENAQQNEDQEFVSQTEDQKTTEQIIEPPSADEDDDSQIWKIDLEKTKSQLEFITVLLALVSVVSTILVKLLSLATYIQFDFDINNCEFKLTNIDIITLLLSLLFCLLAIWYCFETNNFRMSICEKIKDNFFDYYLGIKYIFKGIGLFIIYVLHIGIYLFVGWLAIEEVCKLRGIAPFKHMLQSLGLCTFIFVLLISIYGFVIAENHNHNDGKYITVLFSILLFFLVGIFTMKCYYEEALNKRDFEIIVAENNDGQPQEYVVISKGSSYSAYRCSIEEQETSKVLVIHTDLHRYFPLDDTETKLTIFDEYQLYKYGKPLDALDEGNNSDEYQSNEE